MHSTSPQENFIENSVSKKMCFLISFPFSELFFPLFVKRPAARLSKQNSTCPGVNFEEICVSFEKNVGDLIVFRNEQKISAFCRNFSSKTVKTALDGSIGSIWAFCWIKKSDTFYHSRTLTISFRHSLEVFPASCKKKLSKSLISSWHTAEKFGPFVAKIPAGLPRLHSTCLQEQFETKSFLKKSLELLLSFSDMSDKTLHSWQKSSLRLHRNT